MKKGQQCIYWLVIIHLFGLSYPLYLDSLQNQKAIMTTVESLTKEEMELIQILPFVEFGKSFHSNVNVFLFTNYKHFISICNQVNGKRLRSSIEETVTELRHFEDNVFSTTCRMVVPILWDLMKTVQWLDKLYTLTIGSWNTVNFRYRISDLFRLREVCMQKTFLNI